MYPLSHPPITDRLTYVETGDDYSTYRTRDGLEVYLQHGTRRRLLDVCDFDMPALWQQWQRLSIRSQCEAGSFTLALEGIATEPFDVDDLIGCCVDCEEPEFTDDLHGTNGGSVCQSCREAYWICVHCEDLYRDTTSIGDIEVCEGCLSRNYSWCEDHQSYYWSDDGCDGDHDDDDRTGCCESPAQVFSIRNDGDDPLPNDTRVTVSLPAGVISEEGVNTIARLLQNHAQNVAVELGVSLGEEPVNSWWRLAYNLGDLDSRWQTKGGNYTKRLSGLAYKTFGLKIPPQVLSQVGCIARDHSTSVDFAIETTRDLNMSAEDFYHEESCWWQSYASSRCALKSNGGFALRSFVDRDWYSEVTGRAWVMPMRLHTVNVCGDCKVEVETASTWCYAKNCDGHGPEVVAKEVLRPTFDTESPDAFVVFNGYGQLSGYTPARLMAHMAGMTYRKVGFSCGSMYVNGDSAYLVAPEHTAKDYTDGALAIACDDHSNLYYDERKVLTHV